MVYKGTLKIESIETVARDTKKYLFSVKEFSSLDGKITGKEKLNFIAGQFLVIDFKENLSRAYSIASAPHEKAVELIIRIIPNGAGSMIIDKAKVRDEFKFKAPFGHFTLSKNEKANLIFCGTGTGIAPLRSMILTEAQSKKPRNMKVFYGGRNRYDIAYIDEIEKWAPTLKIRLGLSREENPKELKPYGEKCRITKFLKENDFDVQSEFYICGNGKMVKSTTELLSEKGVEKSRIFMERFN